MLLLPTEMMLSPGTATAPGMVMPAAVVARTGLLKWPRLGRSPVCAVATVG